MQCVSHPEVQRQTDSADTQFEKGRGWISNTLGSYGDGRSTKVTAPRLDPGETELSLSAQSQPEPWNRIRHPS